MIEINMVVSGQDVDLFRGRKTSFISSVFEDQALKLIQARSSIGGEGGQFRINLSWLTEEESARGIMPTHADLLKALEAVCFPDELGHCHICNALKGMKHDGMFPCQILNNLLGRSR